MCACVVNASITSPASLLDEIDAETSWCFDADSVLLAMKRYGENRGVDLPIIYYSEF